MKRELSPWGKQCKIQMVALGKNLYDLSQETSLSRSYISAIINGRMVAPEETVQTISRALMVDVTLAR
ncbi:XRE family transcriptional regulator [bacterium D16-50]|nr:XRE family transcriptional regulator [bacterium D16-50]